MKSPINDVHNETREATYRPQGGEGDAPHALIVLEVVTFEQSRVPLVPGGGRIGEAVDAAIDDAQRRGARAARVAA